jgi:hypothetical protein
VADLGINSRSRLWRQLTGWIAIYALVLQGIVVGLAGPHHATGFAPGHEICLHDAEEAGSVPAGMPSEDDAKLHCPFCVVGGHQVVVPARMSVPAFVVVAEAGPASWTVSERPAASSLPSSANRSRAPPAAA